MSSQPKQNRHRLADRPGKGRGAEPASTPGAEIDPSAGWTIDPPLKHAHHSFHWAYRKEGSKWLVFETRDGVLWHSLGQSWNGPTLYNHGWRYVGPAVPPKTGQICGG
jgi:hypothetical protein